MELRMALLSSSCLSNSSTRYFNYGSHTLPRPSSLLYKHDQNNFQLQAGGANHAGDRHGPTPSLTSIASHLLQKPTITHRSLLLQVAAPVIFFFSFGACACVSGPGVLVRPVQDVILDSQVGVVEEGERAPLSKLESAEEMELKAAFERWKSKTFALTVPLRIVSLRGSVPPSWLKDFVQVQGRRLKLQSEFRGKLEDIFSELLVAAKRGSIERKSALAADIVTIGDSWLSLAVSKGLIEPIRDVEEQDWFKDLDEKWRTYLRRNKDGNLDSDGKIWAVPYRWGSIVIAYKKSKFSKHNLAPIQDWGDLWRPELAGKISMVDSPREVVGAVLKFMGASYNTQNIDDEVSGGRNSVMDNLMRLQRQVRLFDSVHYLKAFAAGDVWVAVGWSSDVLPAAKRLSNVGVIVPKSGASFWADLWAIPAASRFNTDRIGGRVRGPSPLIHQWIEFCLQPARALPFCQEVIPGSSPLALKGLPAEEWSQEPSKGKPKLDTNLIAGVPPPEILSKCEFLEPLSEETLMDYKWLIAGMQKTQRGQIRRLIDYISTRIQTLGLRSCETQTSPKNNGRSS
ncbi:uncharacterized protein [Aristolochia californica]|uniref:uncharacterized protein n=1 Tax=Aristolochia californica TaxID=171875 RepID=UPI0035DFA5C0